MKINKKIHVSFEFFPPRNKEMEKLLWKSVSIISIIKPKFVSITYGANSSKRKGTKGIIQDIIHNTDKNVAPHLTCIDFTEEYIREIVNDYWNTGIINIVALRGDILNFFYIKKYYAKNLVYLLNNIGNFTIYVAAYPEVHQESKNTRSNIYHLKRKINSGSQKAITQFFFNLYNYFFFHDLCFSLSIDIIPGILPIYNFQQFQFFSTITNINIPNWIFNIFNCFYYDTKNLNIIGSNIFMDMIKIFLYEGINIFHIYTLNRFEIISDIFNQLKKENIN